MPASLPLLIIDIFLLFTYLLSISILAFRFFVLLVTAILSEELVDDFKGEIEGEFIFKLLLSLLSPCSTSVDLLISLLSSISSLSESLSLNISDSELLLESDSSLSFVESCFDGNSLSSSSDS